MEQKPLYPLLKKWSKNTISIFKKSGAKILYLFLKKWSKNTISIFKKMAQNSFAQLFLKVALI